MEEIQTDYLVIGAGASGMAYVDTLLSEDPDAEVAIVDRRHRPGGHWLDDYPFVRLHQPSALYGVASRTLGDDRIDDHGENAGWYERASAAAICDYYGRVLDEHFLPTGRVRFLGMHDFRGADGDRYLVRSQVTGRTSAVRTRRRLVDATYIESSIPATHTPPYTVEAGALLLTPNDLVARGEVTNGITVLGAGKTSMDTCVWLLEQGVDPEAVRWVRPRDGSTTDRGDLQPLQLVERSLDWIARHNEVCAEIDTIDQLFPMLEDRGVLHGLDPEVAPAFTRLATSSSRERALLRQVTDVVRLGKVRHVGVDRIELEAGEVPTGAGHLVVDCTAAGLGARPDRPVFEPGRTTIQWVQSGYAPFSAALIAFVEANRDDDHDRNHLCWPRGFTPRADAAGHAAGWLNTQRNVATWFSEPDVSAWLGTCRLSVTGNVGAAMADPATQAAFGRLASAQGPAIENLARLLAAEADTP